MNSENPEQTAFTNNDIMNMLLTVNEKLDRLEKSYNNPIGYLFESIFIILIVIILYNMY